MRLAMNASRDIVRERAKEIAYSRKFSSIIEIKAALWDEGLITSRAYQFTLAEIHELRTLMTAARAPRS